MLEGIYKISSLVNLRVSVALTGWNNIIIWILTCIVVLLGILALFHDFTELSQNGNFEQFSDIQTSINDVDTIHCENNRTSRVKEPNEFLSELESLIKEFKNEEMFQTFCIKFSNLFTELFPINPSNVSPQFLTLILKQIIVMKQSEIKTLQVQELSKLLLCRLGVSKYTLKICYSELCRLNDSILKPELKEFFFSEKNRLQSIINNERVLMLRRIKQNFINSIKKFRFALETIVNFS